MDLYWDKTFLREQQRVLDKQIAVSYTHLAGKRTGTLNASCRPKSLSENYTRHVQMEELWEMTESIVKKWL